MPRTKNSNASALKLVEPSATAQPVPAGKASVKSAANAARKAPRTVEAKPTERIEALVDGRRVVIDAEDEVVIRCGKASITLRRNGRVIIQGTHVETRAEGVNRVKGGSVQIN